MPEVSAELRALNTFFATVVLDSERRIVRANAAYRDLFGLGEADLAGIAETALVPCLSGDESERWAAIRSGQVCEEREIRVSPDGRQVPVECRYFPVTGEAGIDEVVVIVRPTQALGKITAAERLAAVGQAHAVARFSAEGLLLEANTLFHAVLGYAEGALDRVAHADLCDREYLATGAVTRLWQALGKGQAQVCDQPLHTAAGEPVWLRMVFSPVPDRAGRLAEVLVLAEDVTREREREADNAWQIAAIDKSHGVISFDMSGIILDANPQFLKVMGYKRADVVGRHHRMFVEPAYAHGAEYAEFWRGLSRGRHQSGQYRRVSRDGRDVWLQASYNPIFDLSGRPTKIVKYATDITDEKLRQAEHQGQIAAIHKSQCVISFDLDGNILDANDNFLQATGYRLGDIRGRHHQLFVDPESAASAEYVAFWKALARGEHRSGEFRRMTRSGEDLWLQASYNPIFDLSGRPMKIIKYAYDITAERQRQAQYESQIRAIRKSQGVITFALDGTVLDANENFLALSGYRYDELVGQRHATLVDPAVAASTDYAALWDKLRAGEHITGLYPRRRKDGERIWLQASYNPIFDLSGKLVNIVKFATDATRDVALAEAYEEAKKLSQHDSVTSLPNRARLLAFLSGELATPHARVSVLYCDLDRFKHVNDTFGHELGDRVLGEVADRLRRVLRADQMVARVGGDEFVIAAPGLDEAQTEQLCEAVLAAMIEPLRHEGGDIRLGISVGVAMSPVDGTTADELLRNADQALYGVKTSTRGTYQFHASAMNERILLQRKLVQEMRRGIAAGEFFLEYQPRFEPRSLTIVAAEALVRWAHPERGLMPPLSFIPAAESSGLILSLGEWILRTACREAAGWEGEMRISVNVSPVQFRDDQLVAIVGRALDDAGLPASRLEIEVTEGVLLEDPERARAMLNGLKALGVSLAIDDFGTGYASLSYLRNYPFDMIKIDREFVADIGQRPGGRAIIQAILGLGNAMGIAVTAEGVENTGQLASLIHDHCHEVQGYLLARPMPLDKFKEFVAATHERDAEEARIEAERAMAGMAPVDLADAVEQDGDADEDIPQLDPHAVIRANLPPVDLPVPERRAV